MFDPIIENEFKKYGKKIELHCHTNPASPCSEIKPERIAEVYSELGYDAVVLTNHFAGVVADNFLKPDDYLDVYFSDYEKTKKHGEERGLKVYFGMEMRFRENNNDYLVFGPTPEEARGIFKYTEGDLATFRKEYKGEYILIHAHPERNGMVEMDKDLIDGIEVFNMHPLHNSKIGYAARKAKDWGKIATSGSDFHHEGMAGLGGIYVKELPEDEKALSKLLKSGDYILDVGGFKTI